jgi:hypothetical protein
MAQIPFEAVDHAQTAIPREAGRAEIAHDGGSAMSIPHIVRRRRGI